MERKLSVGSHIATSYPVNWITRRNVNYADTQFEAPDNNSNEGLSERLFNSVLRCLKPPAITPIPAFARNRDPIWRICCCHVTNKNQRSPARSGAYSICMFESNLRKRTPGTIRLLHNRNKVHWETSNMRQISVGGKLNYRKRMPFIPLDIMIT